MFISETFRAGGKEYTVLATVYLYTEDWGVDFDGNRGSLRNVVDLLKYEIINEEGIDVTKEAYPMIKDQMDSWIDMYDYNKE